MSTAPDDDDILASYRLVTPRMIEEKIQAQREAAREARWARGLEEKLARLTTELREARDRIAELEPYAPQDPV